CLAVEGVRDGAVRVQDRVAPMRLAATADLRLTEPVKLWEALVGRPPEAHRRLLICVVVAAVTRTDRDHVACIGCAQATCRRGIAWLPRQPRRAFASGPERHPRRAGPGTASLAGSQP